MRLFRYSLLLLCFSSGLLSAKETLEFSAITNSSYAVLGERVLKVAYDRLGIDIVIKSLPAKRALHASNAGVVDGELYRIKDVHLKYKNLVMVPVPIGVMEGIAITKKRDSKITNWADLSSLRTCIRHGVSFSEAGTRKFNVRAVNSNQQLFGMLAKNRCDAIVLANLTSIPLSLAYLKRYKEEISKTVLQVYPLYHYLHKKNQDLVPELEQVLLQMEQEGVISEIRSQYIAEISR